MSKISDVLNALDRDGLYSALRALKMIEGVDRETRLLAVAYARRVQHLMTDPESINALDVVERYANGEAAEEELQTARTAALYVYSDARDAAEGATAAAAMYAAAAAAMYATAAAAAAVHAAMYAAAAMGAAAAADAAAFKAEREWQIAELRRVCECIEAGTDPYPREEA